MIKRFEASNGVEVWRDKKDSLMTNNWVSSDSVGTEDAEALREYFQHERDEELGHWRDPNTPGYIVHPDPLIPRLVTVLHEKSWQVLRIYEKPTHRTIESKRWIEATAAAQAYFEANPEPRPWNDAKVGEVWILTQGDNNEVRAWNRVDGGQWHSSDNRWWLIEDEDIAAITAGRRIYPESD